VVVGRDITGAGEEMTADGSWTGSVGGSDFGIGLDGLSLTFFQYIKMVMRKSKSYPFSSLRLTCSFQGEFMSLVRLVTLVLYTASVLVCLKIGFILRYTL